MKLLGHGELPNEVLANPRHQAAQQLLPELISQLRHCANIQDGYEFQRALLDQIIATETDRNAFSRAVKRIKEGKAPQADAPDPQSGLDPANVDTWQLEYDVCERVGRQFRCVGDALAWRVFGFERKHIIALCQNAPPGVLAGKKGLLAEVAELDKARACGRFAILHDLTNCLRIGDVTVFDDDGVPTTIEVKSNPAAKSAVQRRRIAAAADAVHNGGPLPGQRRRAVLYDLDIPFRTHLNVLADGATRAATEGIFAAKIPGDRALFVTDIYGCNAQAWTPEEFGRRIEGKFGAALRRAGIGDDRQWHVMATSLDSVSRDPMRVPFAAYPMHPVACARFIGDLAVFFVETSGPVLAESVRRAGIEARWVRQPCPGELKKGEILMEMTARTSTPAPETLARAMHRPGLTLENSRTLQMHSYEMDRYLIELLDQATWTEGVRYTLANYDMPGRPWPHYRDEDHVWA